MMMLWLEVMYNETILSTPSLSSSVSLLVSDWKIPGTSKMLKCDRSGPEITIFNSWSEKSRFWVVSGGIMFSSADVALLIPITSVA